MPRPYYLMAKMQADVRSDNADAAVMMKEFSGSMRIGTLEKTLAFALVVSSLAVDYWSIRRVQYAAAASVQTLQKAEADKIALENQIRDLRQQSEKSAVEMEKYIRSLQAGKKDK